MNAERLLVHYDRIADAPDAITRLRRFILDLAVRGKLIPQDSGDEPIFKVLKRIATPAKAGEISPLLKPDELWSIPPSWAFIPLESLATPAGLFTDGDWVESKDQDQNGSVRLTQLADVGVGEFRDRSSRFMNPATAARLNCTFLIPGDILIARMPDPLGRACVFPGDPKPSVTVVDVAVLRLGSHDFFGSYVVYTINSPQFARNVKARASGTTRSRISRGNLSQLPFPVPPLAEQRRIVAKVDELMALCDRLETSRAERETTRDRLAAASLARLNAADPITFQDDARFVGEVLPAISTRSDQIEQLRQTILSLAVRGKLVRQDSKDEPGSELLERILRVRRDLISAKRLRQSTEASNAISNRNALISPPSWAWAKCDQIMFVTKLAGFEYTKYFELKPSGQIPVVRAQNVRPWKLDPSNLLYIEPKISSLLERSALTKPCLLITFIGAGIGDVALFNESRRWHLAPNVAKLEPFSGSERYLDLKYLLLFLISPFGRAEIFKHMKATAQPSISMGTIRDIDFAIPPVAEQHRIVAKVDDLMALCDRLETSLGIGDGTRSRLLNALLAEALEQSEDAIPAESTRIAAHG